MRNLPHSVRFNISPPCVAELDRVGILEDVVKIGRLGYWRGYFTVDGHALAENNYGLNEGHMKYPYPVYYGQHELAAIITRHCKLVPNLISLVQNSLASSNMPQKSKLLQKT